MILAILLFYAFQMMICMFIHSSRATRIPDGVWDFIKLTHLPYVLMKIANKEEL